MLIDIAREFLVEDYSGLLHAFHYEAIRIAENLQIHSRGLMPREMLELARPNEKPEYLEYRKKVYKPFTKTYWAKVAGTGQKIAKAEDWKIDHPTKGVLRSSQSFEDYMENSYPEFDSFTNFWFSWGIKLYYDDPNAVIAVLPLNLDAPDNELRRPYAHIFESTNVIDFVDGKYCVLLDTELSEVSLGNDRVKQGRIMHFLDETTYIKATQVGQIDRYEFDLVILPHGGQYMPALKIGRKIESKKDGRTLYESDLSPCLPFWDEAISDISDHQVNKKLHLHPDRWEIGDTECVTCKGKGTIQVPTTSRLRPFETTSCNTCHGHGVISVKSPFGVKVIKPEVRTNVNNAVSIPTPPMGYAERPIESIAFLKQEVKDNIIGGLAALNMEHLWEEPLATSAVSKDRDREGFVSYVSDKARHFVENIFNYSYEFHNNWRYPFQPVAQRYAALPVINNPQKLDLLTMGSVTERLKKAKEGNFSPYIVAGLEIQLARLEFGKDSLVVKKLELRHKLDPLPFLNSQEKNELVLNSSAPGTSNENYVISCNIDSFITRAIEEKPNFAEMKLSEQLAILKTYAAEIRPQRPVMQIEPPQQNVTVVADDVTAA